MYDRIARVKTNNAENRLKGLMITKFYGIKKTGSNDKTVITRFWSQHSPKRKRSKSRVRGNVTSPAWKAPPRPKRRPKWWIFSIKGMQTWCRGVGTEIRLRHCLPPLVAGPPGNSG